MAKISLPAFEACLFLWQVLSCCSAVCCVIPNGILVFNTLYDSCGCDSALACFHASPICRITLFAANYGNVILLCAAITILDVYHRAAFG